MDIRQVNGLASIDIALGGRLAAELDRLRDLGSPRLDVQVSGGPGGYFLLLHGLSENHEVVVASSFIALDDDCLDHDAKHAVIALYLAGVVARGERQQRRIDLSRSRRDDLREPARYRPGRSSVRPKGRFNPT